MKYIIAVIKPSQLDEVHAALMELGISGLTVSEVRGVRSSAWSDRNLSRH